MANIFSDLFNPKKNITYYPFAQNKVQTTTKGNTSGNVGSVQSATSKPAQNIFAPKATIQYSSPIGPTLPKTAAPQPSQPATTSYDQKYADYLKGRTDTANTLAESASEEAKKQAQEAYDMEKNALNSQVSNLNAGFNTYKTGKAGDVAAYNDVVARNKENATTASGASQRGLAKTRQDVLNQNQKTYAALGTVDSYGTGSFTGANANTENDFLRMTNENYRNLEDKLYTLDQDAASYKRKADMDVASEESKFNDAVIQINKLLAGNEQLKSQAIRQATDLLAQKKAEIGDEFKRLTLETEKQKYDAQQALALESQKGQEVQKAFMATSPEFQKSGQVKDMNDVMFVNKYKDAYEVMMKNNSFSGQSGKGKAAQDMITAIDNLVKTGGVGGITGLVQNSFIPGSKAAIASNYFDQLKGMLSLENRQKLKGSGAISDFEAKTLEQAASALGRNLSETQFMQVLNDLKTKLQNGDPNAVASQQGEIRVQDKRTGQYGYISPSEFDPNLYNQA